MFADDLILGCGQVSVADGTLTLTVGCRLNWYRALPVSCVEYLAVTVGGIRLSPAAVTVRLGGQQIPGPALTEHDDDWWAAGQVAWLDCTLGKRPVEDRYQVRLEIGTRVPYMGPTPDGSWRLVRDECTAWVAA